MEQTVDLARKMVDLFYPLVELAVFDAEGKVAEIVNPFSNLKEDQGLNLEDREIGAPFHELLRSGKQVRSLIYEDQSYGYVRIRYDLSYFKLLQEQVGLLLQGSGIRTEDEGKEVWKGSIDQTMTHYFAENKISAKASSTKQKRELVTLLQRKGLLDFKESSVYAAAKLQISRATLYNYLKTAAEFKKIHVHQVDAFTSERFGGNPAGVVLDAAGLDEATMRKIARELNLSETAFVFPSNVGTFQLRYFTPTGHEIKFCGHSTVGALYMIAKEERFGVVKAGKHAFAVETPCGILNMEISVDREGGVQVAYEAPTVYFQPSPLTHEQVAKAAGFDPELIEKDLPVMFEATNQDLFLPIRSLDDLKKIECDPKAFAHFSKQHAIVALCLFCSESFDPQNQFHMRCFAPLVGIPEDPFTGSVLGGLTAYVDQFKLLPKGKSSFRVEQGHFMDRPGVVEVQYKKEQGNYHVKVLAQATHCFSTEINLT